MPFEDELSEELRRTGETFDLTARTAVVDGALKQGRRSLRRRRGAAVAGSVLALALVGGGGAFGAGLLGGGPGGGTDVASGRPAAPASLRGGLSEEKLAAVLEELLPPGKVSEARGEVTGDEKGPKRASVSAVYDDGKGKGSVLLVLYPLPAGKAARAAECRERLSQGLGLVDGDQGVESQREMCFVNGTKEFWGWDAGGTGGSTGAARATFFMSGGLVVDARAFDRVLGSVGGPGRPGPALDEKGLMRLARADVWRPLAGALAGDAEAAGTDGASRAPVEPSNAPVQPTPGAEDATRTGKENPRTGQDTPRTGQDTPRTGQGSPDPSRPGEKGPKAPPLDYALVIPTLLKLLPEGLTVGEKVDGEGEFASVVVDDGQGKTLVQINVQPDMRSVADGLYGDATTLPDGTLLATSQQPGEKGGAGVVRWTADTMRPDGLRVVVSAFNSGAQSTPATRPEPALTMEQLTAVATSPEWLKLQQK
ncbi:MULTISPECIES: hypothetical protein [unclassified Streptomyces]|uniref:hypothetical protein n=1 Tax=unclassified Streptomyces TaxID=2593676 RepID=UPI001AFA2025|nr:MULTISPECIES: hypothetical protein [unclassified Streptomyces]CAD5964788.1 conserved protein of unknown function [Streptomyces sp. KY75]CAD5978135.1 conserved protein of unknown function [Streptomyces sp. KY70]